MKPKKNPKADLNKNSGLYFVIGLTLVLFLTWRALEYESYDTEIEKVIIAYTGDSDLQEDLPMTETIKLPPPALPPAAPTIIEVVEDTEEIEETIIQSTETDQEALIDAPIISVDEVIVEEVEEEITVPFAVIEDTPVFPGCEQGTDVEKRAAFREWYKNT